MASLRERTEIESPWFYGALTFVTWIVVSGLVGQLLGLSRAEAVDIPTVFSGLVLALMFAYLHSRSLIR
jgi:hypothetical protein